MKVLIGTPIHQIKDYAVAKWLKCVVSLQKVTPANLLIVDNSPGLDYVKKIEGYCKRFGVKNYRIEHLEINQNQPPAERIGRSREIIRQEILKQGYDAWFSWECDQIIPTYTLAKLANIMEAGNYMMVHPNSWARVLPTEPNASFGCCLIKRGALEKHTFMLTPPDDCWAAGESRFKKQVLADGGNYIEIYGVVNPIYHLDNPNK